MQQIRCFDLGGGGLKTALMTYDPTTKTMSYSSSVVQLGKCPDNMKVKDWVRQKMKEMANADLDREIKSGCRFGFSLAGLDKLRVKPVKTSDMSKLFELPSDKTSTIDDGAAHLTASLHYLENVLPIGRIWNFSIGTGVGFGFTNSKKEVKPAEDLHSFFGEHAWAVKEPTTGKQIWEAGGSKSGFDKIVEERGGKVDAKAFEIFAARWKAFIDKRILEQSKSSDKEWGAPAAVVFTGGHIDYHGHQLIQQLNASGLKVKAYAGPKDAGMFGAAWTAIKD